MKSNVYTLADVTTGRLVAHIECSNEQLSGNILPGCVAMPGRYDLGTKRRDVDTGEIVDGNGILKSFEDAATRERLQARIDEIERKTLRRMREILAESDPQLKASDQEIEDLRSRLPRP